MFLEPVCSLFWGLNPCPFKTRVIWVPAFYDSNSLAIMFRKPEFHPQVSEISGHLAVVFLLPGYQCSVAAPIRSGKQGVPWPYVKFDSKPFIIDIYRVWARGVTPRLGYITKDSI